MMSETEPLEELAARVAALESAGSQWRLFAMVERLIPPDARRHLRAARRERLLAARACLDRLIERSERAEQRQERGSHRRISVE